MLSSKCETFASQVAYALAELFSKWGAQVHVKITIKICNLNWQLWHHKNWNMTSSILSACLSNFIQNLTSPQRSLSTQHPIYHTLHWL